MLQTTSEVLSFGRKLEEDLAGFYEELSRRYGKDKDIWLEFASENRKYIAQVERAYYGVISDAIEGCFAFELDPDKYNFTAKLNDTASYAEALKKTIEIEEKMVSFYTDAAAQSKALMADVPRALALVARKRENRRAVIGSISRAAA